jgi:hypothetical protein
VRFSSPRLRPFGLAIVAWVIGAVAAVTVGLLALSTVGAGLLGPTDPLNRSDNVPVSDYGDSTGSPGTSSPNDSDQTFTFTAGTVVAACAGTDSYLVAWSPAPGFRTDDAVRGPAPVTRVKFEKPGNETMIVVTCTDGQPHASVRQDN